ncbi:RsmE family RNA methyltransferase [Mariniplasma anaerobium]|uniref:Ribosomal RNA small subunit methyltransferase E n=1 Tax=Mariniplasma anaerobium TaxID=2735436 RepID=A0A7U9TLX3_9MOLU|nr:RsmE family RNA methyltransferase [Mariniplasma anaerobium]BCR35536.1 ribosomal RNA small subunit methyltransferase E [Mariniplasma anaerobium]
MAQRYFLTKNDFENKSITTDDKHHILKVMRMRSNDFIEVCYLKTCYLAKLSINEQQISYEIIDTLAQRRSVDVTLIQGLPKGNKIDIISKYATMFGVSKMLFVQMDRSIAKEKNSDNKIRRLNLITKEAAELAHRFDIPEIAFFKSLKDIDFKTFDLILLADENEKTIMLNTVVKTTDLDKKIALIIGPEGGISDSERVFFNQKNAHIISLGDNILPTEIAAIYALSYISVKNTELF